MLKELWHGSIVTQEDSRNNSKEMKELLGYMARHHEDLEKTFTDEQKEIFEYTFRLGARLAMEVQSGTNE